MNILIGWCQDCKGIKIAMPDSYKKNRASFEIIDDLKGDCGDDLTTSKTVFNRISKQNDLIIRTMSLDEFSKWNAHICGCTKICKKVKTFDDACLILGIENTIPDYSFLPQLIKVRMIAMYKLIIVTKALNEGWEPQYENQKNYCAYYPTGFYNSDQEFPHHHEFGCDDSYKISNIDYNGGVLLMFKDFGLADYAGVQFRDLYLDLYQYPESYLNRYQK
ncbi:hypothetical protein [Chryseobacterium turcicum]|uniref:Uncharacterized protein n=1 Tax=Chryseobacterium turcicum TaxID=2898076 RepID=A0A9Q3YTT9_9FLAO|nr:hypothetical protein [Chryseobacterium turcicum]MCD1115601.1 hypothetical protein [Chryseobacterium turcicum]